MPRWKPLPEELDPEIRDFAEQMRRLVDRSGLSLSSLADRTGYSKTSWERYLGGRLLPPQGAISALAEVTDTDVRHLATLWELAERAWSRAEMRHDMTMEAIRIAQAREALEAAEAKAADSKAAGSKAAAAGRKRPKNAAARPTPAEPPPPGTVPFGAARPEAPGGFPAREPRSAAPRPAASASGPPPAPWAGQPATAATRPVPREASRPSGGRRAAMLLVGGLCALGVVAGGFFFLGLPGGGDEAAAEPTPPPSPTAPALPEGVKCTGADCSGEDPELMGCGGQYAATTSDAMIGTAYVEVRYSEVCEAAWARIGAARPGDTVTITTDGGDEAAEDLGDSTEGYTMMVAAGDPESVQICVERAGAVQGCTLR
ncbi:helix-turn-helix domain-containing protein [Streptomyces sp. WMMC1477]|uniref:helix-turn-helix domain-containing protein n=1 Tax=Streptomyces sp. WMMC1477 TaxID=3015155 RepID=UPI0022B5F8AE|nr:XRE family transcriptional regulator [Streptomyces sp. WMMC1477]MCZ7433127.1 DUF2690 domain-containing protein [Streptomyces sp. WMMC1477]